MSHLDTVSQQKSTVSMHLPHLIRPQAHVLALWSYGIEGGKNVTTRGGWQWHQTKRPI